MGVFSEEENPWNGGQFECDFQAWEYIIEGSGLTGPLAQPQRASDFLALMNKGCFKSIIAIKNINHFDITLLSTCICTGNHTFKINFYDLLN